MAFRNLGLVSLLGHLAYAALAPAASSSSTSSDDSTTTIHSTSTRFVTLTISSSTSSSGPYEPTYSFTGSTTSTSSSSRAGITPTPTPGPGNCQANCQFNTDEPHLTVASWYSISTTYTTTITAVTAVEIINDDTGSTRVWKSLLVNKTRTDFRTDDVHYQYPSTRQLNDSTPTLGYQFSRHTNACNHTDPGPQSGTL